jgi:signal transduction histidine kinase/Na+/proline symporter
MWEDAEFDLAGLWIAAGLAFFTILFGTRNLDANERHHGVVIAIAVEAVVKLLALLAVGIFVVWGIAGGPADILARIDASPISQWEQSPQRWVGLIFLSGAALICLPRMFQVLVVENPTEDHLATAGWAFPLYLFLMSLFVVPIAVVGLELLPGTNPDLFVLSVPLAEGQNALAIVSFLGGFSSATSMVIVATIALSTMVSNHIVLPIWLRSSSSGAMISGDVRRVLLLSRRLSIGGVLGLGYVYFRLSGGTEGLAAIGLISFVGVVQVLPAMMGGLFWRGATRAGAMSGVLIGFLVWLWTLFLPSFGTSVVPETVLSSGPFGLGWLKPHGLFGLSGLDPLMHTLFWSMVLNAGAFVIASLFTFPGPLERLQGAQFVNVYDHTKAASTIRSGGAEAEDLLIMSQRIIGGREAQTLFQKAAAGQGKHGYLPDVTPEFLGLLERELAGSVGAATAHAMIGQQTKGTAVSVEDLLAVADEAAQIMEYSARLEQQTEEQERTARALREANAKLMQLSVQKDAFLSQISHELRTPMTSIRAFSEILQAQDLKPEEQQRYAAIISEESMRLTRLLDDILDLSVLENGQVVVSLQKVSLRTLIDRSVAATGGDKSGLAIRRRPSEEAITIETDADRLCQVFINLITNARKYCDADSPSLRITVTRKDEIVSVDFADNGSGIATSDQELIFEKFSRLGDQTRAGGAGLGLAICREIMQRLGGAISYLPGQGGAAFRVTLGLARVAAEADRV